MKRQRLTALLVPGLLVGAALAGLPATPKKPVTDVYHGVTVTDDYRWLEDGNDPEVRKWSEAQNAHARGLLDKLLGVETLRARLTKILTAKTTSHSSPAFRGGRFFAIRRQPPKEQPFLVVMPSPEEPDKARVLVDPGALDKKGTIAIDWYVPSPDGRLVAVSLSQGGSETGDIHVYDADTGKQVHEVVPRVNGGTAGGDLAWSPDGKGFFYTRYPRGKERPPQDLDFYQQVYYHELGTTADKDRYELGKDLPRIAEIQLDMDDATGRLLASVQNGDGGEFAHFLREPGGRWRPFASFKDQIVYAAFGPRDDLYIVSHRDAPRGAILRLGVADLNLDKATVVVPEGKDAIVTDFSRRLGRHTVLPAATRLYAIYQMGGPTEVRAFGLEGKPQAAPRQLAISTVGDLTRMGGDDLLFADGSYLEPRNYYLFRVKSGDTVKER